MEEDDSRRTRGIAVKVGVDEDRKRFQQREREVALKSMVYLYWISSGSVGNFHREFSILYWSHLVEQTTARFIRRLFI